MDQSTSGTFEIDKDDEENNEETPLTTTVLDPTEKQFKSLATKNKRKSSEIERMKLITFKKKLQWNQVAINAHCIRNCLHRSYEISTIILAK